MGGVSRVSSHRKLLGKKILAAVSGANPTLVRTLFLGSKSSKSLTKKPRQKAPSEGNVRKKRSESREFGG